MYHYEKFRQIGGYIVLNGGEYLAVLSPSSQGPSLMLAVNNFLFLFVYPILFVLVKLGNISLFEVALINRSDVRRRFRFAWREGFRQEL
jgi:hypothetical protein